MHNLPILSENERILLERHDEALAKLRETKVPSIEQIKEAKSLITELDKASLRSRYAPDNAINQAIHRLSESSFPDSQRIQTLRANIRDQVYNTGSSLGRAAQELTNLQVARDNHHIRIAENFNPTAGIGVRVPHDQIVHGLVGTAYGTSLPKDYQAPTAPQINPAPTTSSRNDGPGRRHYQMDQNSELGFAPSSAEQAASEARVAAAKTHAERAAAPHSNYSAADTPHISESSSNAARALGASSADAANGTRIALDSGELNTRFYHDTAHYESLVSGSNELSTTLTQRGFNAEEVQFARNAYTYGATTHDIVQMGADGKLQADVEALIGKYIEPAEGGGYKIRADVKGENIEVAMRTYGYEAGQKLNPFVGQNEFLTTIATLEASDSMGIKGKYAVAAMHEATIPFQTADSINRTMDRVKTTAYFIKLKLMLLE